MLRFEKETILKDGFHDFIAGIEITINIDKSCLGCSEIDFKQGNWRLIYRPFEETKLYLHTKELIIGGDEIDTIKEFISVGWDCDGICDELEEFVNYFNKTWS